MGRSSWHRLEWWTALVWRGLLVLATLAIGRSALAASAPQQDCEAATALDEELTVGDRRLLRAACEAPATGGKWRGALNRASSDDPVGSELERFRDILRRLVPLGGWTAGLLARSLPDGMLDSLEEGTGDTSTTTDTVTNAPAKPAATPKVGGANTTVAPKPATATPATAKPATAKPATAKPATAKPATAKPAVAEESLAERVKAYVEGQESGLSWRSIGARSRLSEEQTASVRALGGADEKDVLLTIIGRPEDIVTVAVGGRSADVAHVRKTDAQSSRWLFFAWVPRGVDVAVAVERGAQREDVLTWGFSSNADQEIWAELERPECVDLQIAASPGSLVYFDGIRVPMRHTDDLPGPSRVVYAEHGRHRVTVLGPPENRGPGRRVLLNQSIEASEGRAQGCLPFKRDLTRTDFVRTVGLLHVGAEKECTSFGVDAAKVQAHTQRFLARATNLRDLGTLGESAEGIGGLREALSSLGEVGPIGADRGRLDTTQLVATTGQELLRQGFGRLVSLDVHCSNRGTETDYSVVARQLDLDLFSRRERDPIRGVSLSDVVTTEVEVVDDVRRLHSAVVAAVSKLLGLDYTRLHGLPEAASYFDAVDLTVESSVVPPEARFEEHVPRHAESPDELEVAVHALPRAEASRVCSQVDKFGGLRDTEEPSPLPEAGWEPVSHTRASPSSRPRVFDAEFVTRRPGSYLVRSELYRTTESGERRVTSVDYGCVLITRSDAQAWADVAVWGDAGLARFRESRPESYRAYLLLIGVRWEKVPVGAFIGAFRSERTGAIPPTWADVTGTSTRYDLSGRSGYQVVETGVLGGLTYSLDVNACEAFGGAACGLFARRLGAEARVLVFGSYGVTDPGASPFPHFRGETQTHGTFDVGAVLEVGVRIPVSRVLGFDVAAQAGVPKLYQYIAAPPSTVARSYYDGHAILGFSVGTNVEL